MKCPICKESYDQGSRKSTRLSCGHHICQNCRDKSTNRKWKCCYCKNVVDLDEPGKIPKSIVEQKVVVKKTNKTPRRIDELECQGCQQNIYEQDMKYCKKCSGDVKMTICEHCAIEIHKYHEIADIYPIIKFERERMIRECLSPYGLKLIKLFNDMISSAENPNSFEEKELKDIIKQFKSFLKTADIVEKSYDDLIEDYKKGHLNCKQKRIFEFLYGKIKCSECGKMENEELTFDCLTCKKSSICMECKESHLSRGDEIKQSVGYLINQKSDATRTDLGLFHQVIYPYRGMKVGRVPARFRRFLDNEWRLDRMAQVARIYLIYAENRKEVEMFRCCFYSTMAPCTECKIMYNKSDMKVCEKCIDLHLLIEPFTLLSLDLEKMALCQQCANKKHDSSGHPTHSFFDVEMYQNINEFQNEHGSKDKDVKSFKDIVKAKSFIEVETIPAMEEAVKLDISTNMELCENCVNKQLSKRAETLTTLNLDNYALCKKCRFQNHSGHRLHNYEFVAGCRYGAVIMSKQMKEVLTVPLRKFTDITQYPEEIVQNPNFMRNMMGMMSSMGFEK